MGASPSSSSSSSSSSLSRPVGQVKESEFRGETIMHSYIREEVDRYMASYEFVPFVVKRRATNRPGPHGGTRMHTLLICTTFKYAGGSITGIAGHIGSADNYFVLVIDGSLPYQLVKFSDSAENIKEFDKCRCAAIAELNQYSATQIAAYSHRSEWCISRSEWLRME